MHNIKLSQTQRALKPVLLSLVFWQPYCIDRKGGRTSVGGGGEINVLSLKLSPHNSGHQESPNHEIDKRKSSFVCVLSCFCVSVDIFAHNRFEASFYILFAPNLPDSNSVAQLRFSDIRFVLF